MLIAQVTTTTTAEAVSEISEWGSSEIIALVAATGTMLAVLVTGVSIYFNYRGSNRRLASEERILYAVSR